MSLPPLADRPKGYELSCPEGEWIGRLDAKHWGDIKNLVLYFTDESTGGRYWFSVFWRNGYRARDGGIPFKAEEPGARYTMNTRRNPAGNPVFLGATRLDLTQPTGEAAQPTT